ncbi:hypothetical protein DPMN_061387 [Dreissena polymorpha]|uniref:Uncharacterized protein n=1 Tax=Dreissena polymorpha TaxID=45954 RepID=A0A9D4HJ45_DREPO|nr:hypothetical protein DPMN_061387 [Dreissena polymorpha]
MGCGSSASGLIIVRRKESEEEIHVGSVKCHKHDYNVATHYDANTKQFLCQMCSIELVRSPSRQHTTNDAKYIHEIQAYVKSTVFRQRQHRVYGQARDTCTNTEHLIEHYEQTKANLEKKRRQMIDEVDSFVKSVVDILSYLREELIVNINHEITKCQNDANDAMLILHNLLNDVNKLKKKSVIPVDFNQYGHTVQILDELEQCLEREKKTEKYVQNVQPTLLMNKSLQLDHILGYTKHKASSLKSIKLGRINIEKISTPVPNSAHLPTPEIFSDDSLSSTVSSNDDMATARASVFRRSSNLLKSAGTGNASSLAKTTADGTIQINNNNVNSANDLDMSDVELKQETSHISQANFEYADENQKEEHTPSQSPRNWSRSSKMRARNKSLSQQSYIPRKNVRTSRGGHSSIASIGNIDTPRFVLSSSNIAECTLENIENCPLKLINQARLKSDLFPRNITSSAFLNDGAIVLCDQINKKLLLCTDTFQQECDVQFRASPHNIAHIPGYGIAVTFPETNTIQYVNVANGVFGDCMEQIQTKSDCRGVCYANGNLVYTSGNDVAVLEKRLESDTKRTRYLRTAFRKPLSIYMDHDSNLFVTCYGVKGSTGEIIKMSNSGEKIHFVAACREICRPVSTACDRHGYIYVCDVNPPSIHQLYPDGQYCRKLLGPNDGKFQHINVLPNGVFLTTENNNDILSIYRFCIE